MMPHPERHSLPVHDPRWPREGLKDEGDGLRIFRRAVEFARRELAACGGKTATAERVAEEHSNATI